MRDRSHHFSVDILRLRSRLSNDRPFIVCDSANPERCGCRKRLDSTQGIPKVFRSAGIKPRGGRLDHRIGSQGQEALSGRFMDGRILSGHCAAAISSTRYI
jgi:hypothetical protein